MQITTAIGGMTTLHLYVTAHPWTREREVRDQFLTSVFFDRGRLNPFTHDLHTLREMLARTARVPPSP